MVSKCHNGLRDSKRQEHIEEHGDVLPPGKLSTPPAVLKKYDLKNEPVHEISNNVVCATSKASDHPAHTLGLC